MQIPTAPPNTHWVRPKSNFGPPSDAWKWLILYPAQCVSDGGVIESTDDSRLMENPCGSCVNATNLINANDDIYELAA